MGDELTHHAEQWPARALPKRVVQAIFAKLTVRYGSLWARRLTDDNIEPMMRDWATGLAGLSFDSIAWGMENLPDDRPPLLGEFRAACYRAPIKPPPSLAAPPANPERVAAELRRMAAMQAAMKNRDRLQWAYDLAKRDREGDQTLTPAQRLSYQAALASLTASIADFTNAGGGFTPIADDLLPARLRGVLERERSLPAFVPDKPTPTKRRRTKRQPEVRT